MKAATSLYWLITGALLCASCDKGQAGSSSTPSHQPDAGREHVDPVQSWGTGERAKLDDTARKLLEEEADLRAQFTHAAFLACKDPDTALAMLRRIQEKASPGSALHREAERFINELMASDGGTGIDAGMSSDGSSLSFPD